jgi:hypothetical protein
MSELTPEQFAELFTMGIKQALAPLVAAANLRTSGGCRSASCCRWKGGGPYGFPPSCDPGVTPAAELVGMTGFEPATP